MDLCRLLCDKISEAERGGDVVLPHDVAGEIARQLEVAACTITVHRGIDSIDASSTTRAAKQDSSSRNTSAMLSTSPETTPNGNPFIALHDYAVRQHWCLQWPCTTCAAQDLRSELTKWFAFDPDSVLSAARELDPAIVPNLKEGRGEAGRQNTLRHLGPSACWQFCVIAPVMACSLPLMR